MTELDPAYAERLRRACEDALVRTYGREGYLRLLAEARRQHATAPTEYTGVVVGGGYARHETGGNTHEDDRDAAE